MNGFGRKTVRIMKTVVKQQSCCAAVLGAAMVGIVVLPLAIGVVPLFGSTSLVFGLSSTVLLEDFNIVLCSFPLLPFLFALFAFGGQIFFKKPFMMFLGICDHFYMRRQFPNALIKLRSPPIFINGDEACEVCLGEGKSRKVKGGSSSDRFVDKIGINDADSDRLVYRRLKK